MKSQQVEKCRTSCKECIFAEYDGITQIGCSANRLSAFSEDLIIPAYDEEKEFFVINRFCNLYRNNKWNNGIADIEKAHNEAKINYNVIIKIESSITNEIVENISNVIENANETYGNKKINFAIINKFNSDKEYRGRLFSFIKYQNCTVHEYQDIDNFLHEYIRDSKKSFHMVVNMDEVEDSISAIYAFNKFVNHELKEALIFKTNNALLISNMAYKIESIISDLRNYKDICNNIISKAQEAKVYIEYDE
jgi:hypothetical protein